MPAREEIEGQQRQQPQQPLRADRGGDRGRPPHAQALLAPGDRRFQPRHSGGQRRHHQQQEEQRAEDLSARHQRERCWQDIEDQVRPLRRVHAEAEHQREHHQRGEHRDDEDRQHDQRRRAQQRAVAGRIGAVGEHHRHADTGRVEGLPDRGQRHLGVDAREVRLEREPETSRDIAGEQCVEDQHAEQAEQQRRAPAVGDLEPLDDAATGDHAEQRKEREVPCGHLPRVRQEAAPLVRQLLRAEPLQLPARALPSIGEHPAGDDRVVRDDDERRQRAEHADRVPPPRSSGGHGHRTGGLHGVQARATADEELGGEHRDRDRDTGDHEHEDERAAALRADEVGEPPDAAQPDRGADRGEIERELRGPARAHGAASAGRPNLRATCACRTVIGIAPPSSTASWNARMSKASP